MSILSWVVLIALLALSALLILAMRTLARISTSVSGLRAEIRPRGQENSARRVVVSVQDFGETFEDLRYRWTVNSPTGLTLVGSSASAEQSLRDGLSAASEFDPDVITIETTAVEQS